MAFCNRLGGLLKHNIGQTGMVPGAVFNSLRYMSTKLFVGGLSWGTDDQSLKDAFASFGEVVEARVITDRETGRSRGFGFVNFTSDEAANAALSAMDGQELNGRNIRVNIANDRPANPRFGGNRDFGGGYGGGGYGGNDNAGY